MRRMLSVLLAGAVLVPLAACESEPDSGASPSSPAPAPAASPSAAPPPASSPPPASPPATTSPTGSPEPPGPGELPGALPFGDRKLTGVVERSGDCTLLRVGDGLVGLTGTPAQPLQAGDRVTVQGQITTADGGCAAAGAARSVVVRRVTKA